MHGKKGFIVPTHQKESRKQCIYAKGMKLLNTMNKVLAETLLERTKTYTEYLIGNYQCEFIPERSAINQMYYKTNNRKMLGV